VNTTKAIPDVVNSDGTAWWMDELTTAYMKAKGLKGMAWIVKKIDGEKYHVAYHHGHEIATGVDRAAIGPQIDEYARRLHD